MCFLVSNFNARYKYWIQKNKRTGFALAKTSCQQWRQRAIMLLFVWNYCVFINKCSAIAILHLSCNLCFFLHRLYQSKFFLKLKATRHRFCVLFLTHIPMKRFITLRVTRTPAGHTRCWPLSFFFFWYSDIRKIILIRRLKLCQNPKMWKKTPRKSLPNQPKKRKRPRSWKKRQKNRRLGTRSKVKGASRMAQGTR